MGQLTHPFVCSASHRHEACGFGVLYRPAVANTLRNNPDRQQGKTLSFMLLFGVGVSKGGLRARTLKPSISSPTPFPPFPSRISITHHHFSATYPSH